MNFRQRLDQGKLELASNTLSPEQDIPSSSFYALDRVKSPICLELRMEDGSRSAIPYSFFREISFGVDYGITITTPDKLIRITGRKLAPLFDQLILFRVRYIQCDVGTLIIQDDDLVIETLTFEALDNL